MDITKNQKKCLEEAGNISASNMTFNAAKKNQELLVRCKEITDTIIPVGNCKTGKIAQVTFKKDGKDIFYNGAISFSDEKANLSEIRMIDGSIFRSKGVLYIDMHINRLGSISGKKEYTVLDSFTINDDKVLRTSKYGSSLSDVVCEEINLKENTK